MSSDVIYIFKLDIEFQIGSCCFKLSLRLSISHSEYLNWTYFTQQIFENSLMILLFIMYSFDMVFQTTKTSLTDSASICLSFMNFQIAVLEKQRWTYGAFILFSFMNRFNMLVQKTFLAEFGWWFLIWIFRTLV